MIVLALDTCCGSFSVAIKQDEKLLAHFIEMEENKQAEKLVIAIEKILADAKIAYSNIDLLTVTNGPGSFNGIRAGLALVYAIATIQNIPCIGITTLEVLANQLIEQITDQQFYITIAAGRERFYCQLFNRQLVADQPIKLLEQDGIVALNQPVYGDYQEKQLINTQILADMGLQRLNSSNIGVDNIDLYNMELGNAGLKLPKAICGTDKN